jgi:hypothetical protein
MTKEQCLLQCISNMNTLSDADHSTHLLHEHQLHTQAESPPQLAWLTQRQCGVLCSYPTIWNVQWHYLVIQKSSKSRRAIRKFPPVLKFDHVYTRSSI